MTKLLSHLRHNLVAYLALFVALGGTSYAVVNLPANSVGARQIRNHAIGPVKFDPKAINGSVRAWAYYAPAQHYTTGPGQPRVGSGVPGFYQVTWRKVVLPVAGCTVLATVDGDPGFATATQVRHAIGVSTYSPPGQLAPLPFQVVVIC